MQDRIVSYTGDKYKKREFHNSLLRFLEKLDAHCRQYNIPYSLAYGSALGCVRNQGFIPWDDDVDVVMKRVDYDRFFESLHNGDTQLARDSYVEMPLFLPKIYDSTSKGIPVHIDIYAADNVPDGFVSKHLKLIHIQLIKEVIKGRRNHLPGLIHLLRKVIAYSISFPFSMEKINRLYTTVCIKDNNVTTQRISSYCAGHKSMGKYYPSSMIDHTIYMKFEDIELPVMMDNNLYLSNEYGSDYMTPRVL